MTDHPPLSIDELERLANAATPGPWHFDDEIDGKLLAPVPYEDHEYDAGFPDGSEYVYVMDSISSVGTAEVMRNHDFIAAANPATILALIDRLRKAESRAPVEITAQMSGRVAQATAESRTSWEMLGEDGRALWLRDVRAIADALVAELNGSRP